ncbi:MAG: TrkH family potassium uptake protein [Phycisphaerales bacterium]|nr:TrkH family potassium uptake protein [Phycisphaerales bacterium]
MKFAIVIDLIGRLLKWFTLPLGICAAFSAVEYAAWATPLGLFKDPAFLAFVIAGGVSWGTGCSARWATGHASRAEQQDDEQEKQEDEKEDEHPVKKKAPLERIQRREATLLVVGCYFVVSLVAAIPFIVWSVLCDQPQATMFHGFVNPWFEAMSGITTCGATILPDIEILPRSILFWRAFIQWVGGIGFVVLFVAFLPYTGVGGRKMFMAEATGPSPEGLRPNIKDTGLALLKFYLGLTLVAMLLLMACGMDWFDAVCHSFTTVATAGFSTRNASIASFDSASIELVVMAFMLASGVGFALYYSVMNARGISRKLKPVRTSKELHLYLMLALLITTICTVSLLWVAQPILLTTGEEVPSGFFNSLRYGAFATISILTTTGYTAAAYETWPALAIVALMSVYIVGGMAGSTAGGMKIIRVWIAGKMLLSSIEKEYDPKVVRPVKIGKSSVPSETRAMVLVFVMFTLLMIGVGAALLETFEGTRGIDFTTSLTAAASAVANVGPGLSRVGADDTYAFLSAPSKITLTVLMLMGRVELLMVLALFTRRFWSRA